MANQALDHLLVFGLVHLHDFGDGAASAAHDTDECSETMAIGRAVGGTSGSHTA
jgi:hypothetical protein